MLRRVKEIKELKQMDQLVSFMGGKPAFYEYLMPHPRNENYVLMLDTLTMDAKKVYIPDIIKEDSMAKWFRYDSIEEVEEKELELLRKRVDDMQSWLSKKKKKY